MKILTMNLPKLYFVVVCTIAFSACSTNEPVNQLAKPEATPEAVEAVKKTPKASEKPIVAENTSKVVCKRIVPTGSRLGSKSCKTVRKWKEMERAAKETLRNVSIKSGHQGQVGN